MDDLEQLLMEDRRLLILRFLAEDNDYTLNTSILQTALAGVGNSCSRAQVETACAWLQEQGLVTLSEKGNVTVVKLTGDGQDVAEGNARVPGVKRPRAGR